MAFSQASAANAVELTRTETVRQYVPVLDGIRGVAILGVLVFHFFGNPVVTGIAGKLMYIGAQAGRSGVDLFFVLSGFLITGILLKTKEKPNYLRNFYMRRALRIFPLYYAVVILVFCINSPFREKLPAAGWFVTYTQNIYLTFWRSPNDNILAHFWSLSVEEHFYLFWPLIVLKIENAKLVKVAFGIIVLALIARLVLIINNYDPFYLTLSRMDALAVGSLFALLARESETRQRLLAVSRWLLVILPILIVPFYLSIAGSGNLLFQLLKYPLLAFLFAAAMIIAQSPAQGGVLARFFNFGFLRTCGKYSYGMYVFHPFVFYALRDWLAGSAARVSAFSNHVVIADLIGFGLCSLGVLLAAWISYHVFEQRFLELKRFFAT